MLGGGGRTLCRTHCALSRGLGFMSMISAE
jgi:hypothetical protein